MTFVVTKALPHPTDSLVVPCSVKVTTDCNVIIHLQTNHSDYAQYITSPHPRVTSWNIDAMVCDVIGCYGYDANTAAAAVQVATKKDGSSAGGDSFLMRS